MSKTTLDIFIANQVMSPDKDFRQQLYKLHEVYGLNMKQSVIDLKATDIYTQIDKIGFKCIQSKLYMKDFGDIVVILDIEVINKELLKLNFIYNGDFQFNPAQGLELVDGDEKYKEVLNERDLLEFKDNDIWNKQMSLTVKNVRDFTYNSFEKIGVINSSTTVLSKEFDDNTVTVLLPFPQVPDTRIVIKYRSKTYSNIYGVLNGYYTLDWNVVVYRRKGSRVRVKQKAIFNFIKSLIIDESVKIVTELKYPINEGKEPMNEWICCPKTNGEFINSAKLKIMEVIENPPPLLKVPSEPIIRDTKKPEPIKEKGLWESIMDIFKGK